VAIAFDRDAPKISKSPTKKDVLLKMLLSKVFLLMTHLAGSAIELPEFRLFPTMEKIEKSTQYIK